MSKQIRTLTVIFDSEISSKEIPFFRGAVINSLGEKANVLYHNHTGEETLRYSYPLIQYKRLNRKAAITCVEEGADIIGYFLSETSESLMIGNRKTRMTVEKVFPEKTTIQVKDSFTNYHLSHWLPLNSENYAKYQGTDSLVERIQILEHVLAGNILSFLKGVGIHLEEHFIIHIMDILSQKVVTYKDVKLMAFDIKFKANISLPQYIGIGKNASVGYGLLSYA